MYGYSGHPSKRQPLKDEGKEKSSLDPLFSSLLALDRANARHPTASVRTYDNYTPENLLGMPIFVAFVSVHPESRYLSQACSDADRSGLVRRLRRTLLRSVTTC